MGKNVLRASGLLLAPSVVAGCTRTLLWELSPSSAPPCIWLESSAKTAPCSSAQHELCSLSQLVLPLTICLLMQPDGLSSPTLHADTFSSLCLENALVWPAAGRVYTSLWEMGNVQVLQRMALGRYLRSDSCLQTCTKACLTPWLCEQDPFSDHIPVSAWTNSWC